VTGSGRFADVEINFKKNISTAIKWLTLGAKQQDPESMMYLAGVYCGGKVIDPSIDLNAACLKWIKNAAAAGVPKLQFGLGMEYHEGKRLSNNKSKALMWFLVANQNKNERFYQPRGVETMIRKYSESAPPSLIKKAKKMAEKCIRKKLQRMLSNSH
jgi:hypothetical protein